MEVRIYRIKEGQTDGDEVLLIPVDLGDLQAPKGPLHKTGLIPYNYDYLGTYAISARLMRKLGYEGKHGVSVGCIPEEI